MTLAIILVNVGRWHPQSVQKCLNVLATQESLNLTQAKMHTLARTPTQTYTHKPKPICIDIQAYI